MIDFPEIKLFQMEQWHLETGHHHDPTHSFGSCGRTFLSMSWRKLEDILIKFMDSAKQSHGIKIYQIPSD